MVLREASGTSRPSRRKNPVIVWVKQENTGWNRGWPMQSAAKERRVLSGPVRLDYARIVSRDIILLALVIGAAAGALIIADVWIDHALKDWLEWSVALALVCGAALVIQLVRLSIIWRGHLQTNASRPEAANWSELFGYLFGVQVVLSGIVFLSTDRGQGVLLVDDRGNKPNRSTGLR